MNIKDLIKLYAEKRKIVKNSIGGIFFTNAFLKVVPNGFTPLFLETEIPQRIECYIHEV